MRQNGHLTRNLVFMNCLWQLWTTRDTCAPRKKPNSAALSPIGPRLPFLTHVPVVVKSLTTVYIASSFLPLALWMYHLYSLHSLYFLSLPPLTELSCLSLDKNSQDVVPRPAAEASPEKLLEMQILTPNLSNQTLGLSNLHFNKPSRWFLAHIKVWEPALLKFKLHRVT